ncbi:hypothetical protein [Isoptericola halotolerans]|uniref:Major facilitator superfamily (MFS) profile domain-containing protein n=1 Tax=Isoptericola halotolerans TaxID=300560 RepID=A0ABX2A395_9MICO|nr:hypothetical protein [Isoptericola halotolerans]NOV96088.1 hypothetical protein [Isoptericola halotolerans]
MSQSEAASPHRRASRDELVRVVGRLLWVGACAGLGVGAAVGLVLLFDTPDYVQPGLLLGGLLGAAVAVPVQAVTGVIVWNLLASVHPRRRRAVAAAVATPTLAAALVTGVLLVWLDAPSNWLLPAVAVVVLLVSGATARWCLSPAG